MQYLKSREGRDKSRRQRRKSSLDLYELSNDGNDKPQFSCLDEKVHGPCSGDILLPPNELMTRPRAFRQAYWKHHCKPTIRAIEPMFQDDRKERLNKKRKEILAKIRKSEARKREADMRRRVEKIYHSNSGIDSEESGDESESELELTEQMNSLSMSSPSSQTSREGRKTIRSSILSKRSDDSRRSRRTIVGNLPKADVDEEPNDAFAFLSEWASTDQKKIRW